MPHLFNGLWVGVEWVVWQWVAIGVTEWTSQVPLDGLDPVLLAPMLPLLAVADAIVVLIPAMMLPRFPEPMRQPSPSPSEYGAVAAGVVGGMAVSAGFWVVDAWSVQWAGPWGRLGVLYVCDRALWTLFFAAAWACFRVCGAFYVPPSAPIDWERAWGSGAVYGGWPSVMYTLGVLLHTSVVSGKVGLGAKAEQAVLSVILFVVTAVAYFLGTAEDVAWRRLFSRKRVVPEPGAGPAD